MTQINVAQALFAANDEIARSTQQHLHSLGIIAMNVMASPGAGKTSLLLKLLERLPKNVFEGVIEGDVASALDTEKIIKAGFPAVQINTGGGCHLTAAMVATAIQQFPSWEGPGVGFPLLGDVLSLSKGGEGVGQFQTSQQGFLFIENIGNLICPSAHALGEDLKLVIASVPEGDDKPVKYPNIFAIADVIVLNKIDYLSHSDFNLAFFSKGIQAVNPAAPVFQVSCKTDTGLSELAAWVKALKIED